MNNLQIDSLEVRKEWSDEHNEFISAFIVTRSGNSIQYGENTARGKFDDIFPKVQMTPVPREEIYPLQPEHLHIYAAKTIPQGVYIKRPSFGWYWLERGTQALAHELLHEVQLYENHLLTNPHPNLPEYYGCLVEGGRVVGLVLDRYACRLSDRRESMDHAARWRCFRSVEAVIRHLHGLGLAHNDISADNIMFDEEGNTCLIDFNACAPENLHLRGKGTSGWNEGFTDYSSFANDEAGLRQLMKYLELVAITNPDTTT